MKGFKALTVAVGFMGSIASCSDDEVKSTPEAEQLRTLVKRVDLLPVDTYSEAICALGTEISDMAMDLIETSFDNLNMGHSQCVSDNNYMQCEVEGPDYKTKCIYDAIDDALQCGLYLTQDVLLSMSGDGVIFRPGAGVVFHNIDQDRMITVAGSFSRYTFNCESVGADAKVKEVSDFIRLKSMEVDNK